MGHSEETGKVEIYAETLSLDIPLAILLGWFTNVNNRLEHVLPRSLEHLCLRDDLSNFCAYPWRAAERLPPVSSLLDVRATHIPRLSTISFKICVD